MAVIVDVPVSVQNTAGTTGTWNWAGQSVTMPSGASYTNIKFAWYLSRPMVATAFGRLYVLDQAYFGLPRDLSPSTPGFLARSEAYPSGFNAATADEYELPDDLRLAGGKQYFFYTDAQGSFSSSFDQDVYAGGQMFHTGYKDLAFYPSRASGRTVNGVFVPAQPNTTVDANFRVRGIAQ